ncbi:MAG: PHB depolymerase family esterase [Pyrinomonadaceae bacterium]
MASAKLLFVAGLLVLLPAHMACAQGKLREKIRERIENKRAEQASVHDGLTSQIQVGDLTRSYYLFVPSDLPKNREVPLVFVFHGGGGNGKGTETLTNFSRLAEKENFIVAYPDAIAKNWNDGRENEASKSYKKKVDDVAFVKALIDSLEKDYRIDNKRIFATGISNGAIFSHYLAANMSEKIAAIAPVAGGIAEPFDQQFKLKEPVSVFVIQGTSDPLVPYNGGEIASKISFGKSRGKVIGTDETIRLWTEQDNTKRNPITGILPDSDKNDGCTVETFLWTNGKNGTEVKFFKQNGGGHTWAGGSQYLPRAIIGNVCRDFDASEVIWEFFKQHPKS